MTEQESLFAGLPPESAIVARFTVDGEPVSKARARFTGYGSKSRAYTPAKTKTAEARMAMAYRQARGQLESDPEVTFGVTATFFNGTRQRRDVDNMLKLVLDSLNGVAWVDDMQVTEVVGRKRFTGRDDARTEVVVYRIGRIDRLTKPCRQCGDPFITYPSQKHTSQFCSPACRDAEARDARRRVCRHCGDEFQAEDRGSQRAYCSPQCRREHGKQTVTCTICEARFETYRSWASERNYCSPKCRRIRDAETRRARRTKSFPGTCAICGAGTTRKEYRRCNPCKLAGKTTPPLTPEEETP